MPSMAPLSSGNKNGDGNGNVPGRGNGVPFGGHWGPPESTSATPSAANEAVGKRKATTLLPQTRVTKRQALLNQRRALPIASVESELVNHVKKNETLVVIGETGSGKTTQLPQFLHSAGFCKGGMMVAITQPRRVAAITVATRVAEEMGVEVGQEVGYSIRFEDCTSPSTQLKYMTDGMLLREALLDPLLSRYSLVVIDEAHERTIHTDVLFGLLKGVQKRRQAASTATKSSKKKAATTGVALKDLQNLLTTSKTPLEKKNSALKLVIHLEEIPGDILLFLTGQEEIESMERLLKERASHLSPKVPKLLVVPIYAALPSEQQMRVFQPAPDGTRKVILATNIAETSLTIPGIRYVIDPGLVKARAYNPRTGVESLEVVPVSKAQARQRSGRAGRERPGKCFRLYTEDLYRKLEDSTVPEIKRCNLANVVLQLKAFGIDDVLGFDFMDKPSRIAIVKSLEHLYSLGALTDEGKQC
uniref:RNA helicase n=1 Tax=Physcomitrium patens TaxID=3218 RepID=A0A7I4EI91_PHYPA